MGFRSGFETRGLRAENPRIDAVWQTILRISGIRLSVHARGGAFHLDSTGGFAARTGAAAQIGTAARGLDPGCRYIADSC
jgi:hypothetical protein